MKARGLRGDGPPTSARKTIAAMVVALSWSGACSGSGATPAPALSNPTPPTTAVSDAGARAALDAGTVSDVPEGSLSSRESKAVAHTLTRVSELRGLPSKRAVPGVKLDRDKLVGRVKEKALREYPPEALRREGQLLQLFGFAPPTFDYLREMMSLLDAQLEGFYEPQNGSMYLAADLRGKEAEATLAHELVHALQDQTWDLKSRSSYRPGKGDETLALACLAEGDATSLMMDFVMAEKGRTALDLPEEILSTLMANGVTGASTTNVPHILRSSLIAPYADGLAFTHALRKKGGWSMVDRAWQRPPVTTEQILHVEKWENHEPAIAIAPPSARTLGSEWKMEDEDTFGELGLALTFEEWISTKEARLAAAGWGGDRSAVYAKGDEIAFAAHVRYDTAATRPSAFAERAMTSLAPGLKKQNDKPSIETRDAICFDRKDLGPIVLARKDRDLVIAVGPVRARPASFTSTSTCAQTKQWAEDILATP